MMAENDTTMSPSLKSVYSGITFPLEIFILGLKLFKPKDDHQGMVCIGPEKC